MRLVERNAKGLELTEAGQQLLNRTAGPMGLVQWGKVGSKPVELWVPHTSRRLASPKVKAFVEFMANRYPDGTLVLSG